MKTVQYRGYDIVPDCPYDDQIRRWGVLCQLRKQGNAEQQPVPAATPHFFANHEDAIVNGVRYAKAMIDGHLDRRSGALIDLDRF
ncbi:CV_2116 domain-containing protein [Ralstonia syzygii]|uniref:CV_2116 domain-containing protein n=1 Tax=Ralstonia syzygii TaxID=28097 RepID=UPI0018CFF0D4|nr:hypothetical protein [Ralstonia syzygii]